MKGKKELLKKLVKESIRDVHNFTLLEQIEQEDLIIKEKNKKIHKIYRSN